MFPPLLDTRLHLYYIYQKDKRVELWNLLDSNALSDVAERWIEEHCQFAFCFRFQVDKSTWMVLLKQYSRKMASPASAV
jgi:hypothetical protein